MNKNSFLLPPSRGHKKTGLDTAELAWNPAARERNIFFKVRQTHISHLDNFPSRTNSSRSGREMIFCASPLRIREWESSRGIRAALEAFVPFAEPKAIKQWHFNPFWKKLKKKCYKWNKRTETKQQKYILQTISLALSIEIWRARQFSSHRTHFTCPDGKKK